MSQSGEADAGSAQPAGRGKMHRTSLGALALSASGMLRLGLQFALLPILARLVGPAEYGLVSLAMPFVILANVLADGGMGFALGRRREASVTLESTVFWLSGGIGVFLMGVCCAAAWPMGVILNQPRLPLLLLALSPMLLMNSLTAVSNGRIIREGRFTVFAIGDFTSTLIGAVTALVAASHGFGAWSLILQQLALWATKFVWLTWKGGAAIRPRFHFAEAKPLLGFGFSTIGAMLADFVSRNVDSLIVGAVLGATSLGYYAMAYQVIRIPDMLIVGPLYMYIFTAVSRTAHDGGKPALQELASAALRLGASALAPLFVGLALIADLAVTVVLGDKWLGAIAPLRWLAGAGFAIGMCALVSTTLMGMGRSALQLRLSMLLGVTTIVTVAGAAHLGLAVVSATLAAGLLLALGYFVFRLAKDLAMPITRLGASFAPGAIGSVAMTAAVVLARRELAGVNPAIELVAMIALGAGAYLAVIWMIARRRLLADLRAFGRAQADKPTPEAMVEGAELAESVTQAA